MYGVFKQKPYNLDWAIIFQSLSYSDNMVTKDGLWFQLSITNWYPQYSKYV